MTDWVAQDDWSQVKVGDPVRGMRAEQMLTGVVIDRFFSESSIEDNVYAIVLEVGGLGAMPAIHHGYWQLSVPAKPAVELPTEVGWYLAFDKMTDALFPVEIDDHGTMLINHAGGNPDKLGDPERFVPFIPLAPVAVTAKKVIEFIESDLSCDSYDTARKEFGVSDD